MRAKGSRKNETKATEKDVVFTRPTIAKQYVEQMCKLFPQFIFPHMHAIEPSAGGGAFLAPLKQYFASVDAFDIDPKHGDVVKQDFLDWQMPVERSKSDVICWGNPPFSIAKKFIQKCASISDHIVMILPQRYFQNIPRNTLSLEWKVEYARLLPMEGEDAPFEGKSGVTSALMYLHRVDGFERPMRVKTKPNGFTIRTYHGADSLQKATEKPDVLFWQAGPKAGKRVRIDEIGNGMAYGLHFHDKVKLAKIQEENLEIETIRGTNGFSYISMEKICKTLQ